MSERGTDLMKKASQQIDGSAAFFGTLNEADLRKPCPGEGAGDTVGAVAAHLAEGYHYLGQFLQTTGYVPGAPATGTSSHGPGDGSGQHVPAALPYLLNRLSGAKAPISLLADLTDEQLDSVPPAANRFADGRRTLEEVIERIIAHQAARLVTLKRAVA